MTNTENICRLLGENPPNVDLDSGIHYGVISMHDISAEMLDEIYSNGIDLTFEHACSEVKAHISFILGRLTAESTLDETWEVLSLDLRDYVRDSIDESLAEDIRSMLRDGRPKPEIVSAIWLAIESEYNDNYCIDSSDSVYRYYDPTVTIETSGTDLFITKSSFYTLCRECSPCAPNAGYLSTAGCGNLRTYCLPAEWFEDKAPYEMFPVTAGSEVSE